MWYNELMLRRTLSYLLVLAGVVICYVAVADFVNYWLGNDPVYMNNFLQSSFVQIFGFPKAVVCMLAMVVGAMFFAFGCVIDGHTGDFQKQYEVH